MRAGGRNEQFRQDHQHHHVLAACPRGVFSSRLLMGAGVMSLCLAVSSLALLSHPALAQTATQEVPPSAAASSARQLLDGPRPTLPVMTDRAGMGTREAPAPAKADSTAPQAATTTAAPENPAAPALATAAPTTETAPAEATPALPPAASAPVTASAPVRGGIDSAGDTASAPVAAVPQAAPSQAVTSPTPAPVQAAVPAPSAESAAAPSSGTAEAAPANIAPAAPAQAATPAAEPARTQASTAPEQTRSPIADALAALLVSPEKISATTAERQALFVFYAARSYQPVFLDEKGLNSRGAAVLARLEAAGEDGLNPADYQAQAPAAGAQAPAMAQAELDLAVAAITYARHAQSGRFNPTRISALVTPTRDIPRPEAILADLADTKDANAALAAYNPPHPGYEQLKAALAATIGTKPEKRQVNIPSGPLLRPGAQDERVPALRARLGLSQTTSDDLAYDPELMEAVKAFQESSMRIKPTGMVGDATVQALNRRSGRVSATHDDIIANMERWRWLPRDLGASHVMVNIPEYMLRIYSDGRPIHSTRVVVGRPDAPTALISKPISYAVVNPAWNIPPTIVRKQMMPLLQSNPAALARRGIEVTKNRSGGYSFRKKPGPNNDLGRIKFMFPNDHAIYLHDTPAKNLFSNTRRANSSGCVRVQNPFDFGSVLFNLAMEGQNWDEARFARMFGPKERYINLKRPIPVHLVYFTLAADAHGRLTSYEDLYGFNSAVKNRLGLDGRHHVAERGTTRKN